MNKAVNEIKQGKIINKNIKSFLMISLMQKEIAISHQLQDLPMSNIILPNKRKIVPQREIFKTN